MKQTNQIYLFILKKMFFIIEFLNPKAAYLLL